MSHSDLESPNPTCDHQGIHCSLRMLLLLSPPRVCGRHRPGWGAAAGSGKQWEKSSFLLRLGGKTSSVGAEHPGERWNPAESTDFQRWQRCLLPYVLYLQSAGSVMRSNGCLEVLVFNFHFNKHLGLHNYKLNSINSDKGRSFHLPRPRPPSQKLFWQGCLRKLS